ncbi:MAG: DUF222 domain-containing protein, partial [Acidimicrobiales bacterium]
AHETASAALCAALDPDSIPLPEVGAAYDAVAHMARLFTGARTRLARRVDESKEWQRNGCRNPAEYLAGKDGVSEGAAKSELETSKALADLPNTDDAVSRGELSPQQAGMVTTGATADPTAESKLLDTAKSGNVRELKDEVARTKAAADPNPDATQERLHRERFLRLFQDLEGACNLTGKGTAADGATLKSILDPMIDELFHTARREGRHESRDAYAWDAMIELLRRGTGHAPTQPVQPDADDGSAYDAQPANDKAESDEPDDSADQPDDVPAAEERQPQPAEAAGTTPAPTPKPKQPNLRHLALLRVDLEALVRGHVTGDELCEIAGLGPVPVTTARALLGDAILRLVITGGVDVLNVTNLGRGATAAQQIALLWSSPTCIVAGCTRPAAENDHQTDWAQRQRTDLADLNPKCGFHHDLKTYKGWSLVTGKGRRAMVPPDDPRHPANAPPATSSDTGRSPPDDQTLFGPDAA